MYNHEVHKCNCDNKKKKSYKNHHFVYDIQERKNMMALIANLQQNLYEAKTSLLVPSSKLELIKQKLNLLPTEFGRELVSFRFQTSIIN